MKNKAPEVSNKPKFNLRETLRRVPRKQLAIGVIILVAAVST